MTERFNDRVEAALEATAAALADGFDVEDVAVLVRHSVEAAESVEGLSGAEKQEVAKEFAGRLVDRFFQTCTPRLVQLIEEIDIPFVPEAVERATIDPLLRAALPSLIRPLVKAALPSLFDLVVDATRGGLSVNTKAARCLKDTPTGMSEAPSAPCVRDPGHDGPCGITP